MTGLLVSVRSVAEARIALDGGASLIDVKEPSRGALGRADVAVQEAVVSLVGGRVPVSAALGELSDCPPAPARGCRYAKLGLADCAAVSDWPSEWARAIGTFAGGVTPVGVAYADWKLAGAPAPRDVVRHAARLGCGAVLIDTYHKSKGNLLDHLQWAPLARFVEAVRDREMLVVLAGSLSVATIPIVMPLRADYIAVRGAACRGERTDAVDAGRVARLARLVADAAE